MRNIAIGLSVVAAASAGCATSLEGSPSPDSSPFATAACKEVPGALSQDGDRVELLPHVGKGVLDCVINKGGEKQEYGSKAEIRANIAGGKGSVLFLAKSAFRGGFSPARTEWVQFSSRTSEGGYSSVELSKAAASMTAGSRALVTDGEQVSIYDSGRHLMTSKDSGTVSCAEKLITEKAIQITSVKSDTSNIARFEVPESIDDSCKTTERQ